MYADWLGEHGEGDRSKATAEFIRLSCNGARHGKQLVPAHDWLTENWQRLVPSILRHHTPHFGEPSKRWVSAYSLEAEVFVRIRIVISAGRRDDHEFNPGIRMWFRRGFLDKVTINSATARRILYPYFATDQPVWVEQRSLTAAE